ncbi:uncharacterized protein TRIADDRAFT_32084 [Trichoplax adhaerens]|uniref:Doublecortin domain-containing protein n=1 Tax=Trichoplax adhaerens TaxID=10228 RepID=B3S9X2_TRIAD|nr:hypothetical protein TRIADDRAFT_32084 [Trichoplax adhaerens]EDV20341.1 hypothetical protein TRIADDRAFT_32084 [Trichoplax adhaerens]|eukprot:XP_002117035.1 hypothetical protein TRIADDRAFT_32084 [Trichoplax adhaerens]
MTTTRLPPIHGFHIHVYRNGDRFYKPRRFTVNPKQVRSFDALLSMVTNGINSRSGAVRNIYTPTFGHKVQDMASIQQGGNYVAGGSEKFVRIQ